ncbi:hypothetical protein RND81_01G058900 [Saponaria officinalis]|uniref:Uncharacterized protein n=1 Tax=Saponaria officinalis TaxID=3572 RepID=A0AAW1NGR5_SAPOF
MTVEFDDLDRPRGKWRLKYGQHLGFCMRKFNINWNWKDVSEGKRKLMWEDTMNARQGKIFLMSKLNKGSVLLVCPHCLKFRKDFFLEFELIYRLAVNMLKQL